MFSGGDAAKPLKVALSASADGQPRCWEAGLVGMRKGGVRYVAVTAAAVAAEVHLGRGEAGPGGARLYRLEVLKMKRGDTSKEAASSSAPDAVVATEGAEVPHDPATSPLPTSTPPTPTPATPPPAGPPPAPLAAESAITATATAASASASTIPPQPAAAADEAQQAAAGTLADQAAADADTGGVHSEAASGFAAARAVVAGVVAGVVGGEKSEGAAKVTASPHRTAPSNHPPPTTHPPPPMGATPRLRSSRGWLSSPATGR